MSKYDYITNPADNKKYLLQSKFGQTIFKKYIIKLGQFGGAEGEYFTSNWKYKGWSKYKDDKWFRDGYGKIFSRTGVLDKTGFWKDNEFIGTRMDKEDNDSVCELNKYDLPFVWNSTINCKNYDKFFSEYMLEKNKILNKMLFIDSLVKRKKTNIENITENITQKWVKKIGLHHIDSTANLQDGTACWFHGVITVMLENFMFESFIWPIFKDGFKRSNKLLNKDSKDTVINPKIGDIVRITSNKKKISKELKKINKSAIWLPFYRKFANCYGEISNINEDNRNIKLKFNLEYKKKDEVYSCLFPIPILKYAEEPTFRWVYEYIDLIIKNKAEKISLNDTVDLMRVLTYIPRIEGYLRDKVDRSDFTGQTIAMSGTKFGGNPVEAIAFISRALRSFNKLYKDEDFKKLFGYNLKQLAVKGIFSNGKHEIDPSIFTSNTIIIKNFDAVNIAEELPNFRLNFRDSGEKTFKDAEYQDLPAIITIDLEYKLKKLSDHENFIDNHTVAKEIILKNGTYKQVGCVVRTGTHAFCCLNQKARKKIKKLSIMKIITDYYSNSKTIKDTSYNKNLYYLFMVGAYLPTLEKILKKENIYNRFTIVEEFLEYGKPNEYWGKYFFGLNKLSPKGSVGVIYGDTLPTEHPNYALHYQTPQHDPIHNSHNYIYQYIYDNNYNPKPLRCNYLDDNGKVHKDFISYLNFAPSGYYKWLGGKTSKYLKIVLNWIYVLVPQK